jgi:hypothetical protein
LGAYAAELDGERVPDTVTVDRSILHLNGFGLRTYSILRVHIYSARLYLEHLSSDAEAIIHSQETKLLTVKFEHSVSADQARDAWRKGLANNCTGSCELNPDDVQRFLSEVPAMRANDTFYLLFRRNTATVTVNGRQIGTISQPRLAEAMLATFLGPNPASPSLRQELLGGHS